MQGALAKMETPGDRDSLRSSWQDLQHMPDQADAAQGSEPEETQEELGTKDSPAKLRGAQDAGSQPVESQVVLEDSEWILKDSEDPAISEQECFEGEAEVVPEEHNFEDKGLRFEEEESCVHAAKPDSDAVTAVAFDSASEGDPEASSLAGSDCEYAFILDRPNAHLPCVGQEVKATPDKGRSMPQSPAQSPMSPKQGPQSPSLHLAGHAPLQAARSCNQSCALSPAPPYHAPPCTEGCAPALGPTVTQQDNSDVGATPNAASMDNSGVRGSSTDEIKTEGMAMQRGSDNGISSREPAPPKGDNEPHSGGTSREEQKKDEDSLVQASLNAAPQESMVPTSLHVAAEELARQRRRQLDAVGVIPGGRAAFGAKLPADNTVTASRSSATDGWQPRQQDAGVRQAPTALPELARPAAPDWARPRGRWLGSSGSGSSGGSVAPMALLRRLQARLGATPDGRRAPMPARQTETTALAGTMLESYDSLWHGNTCIVAGQS